MSRRSTARGSRNGLVPVGPAKVKACKSTLFTEGTLDVEIFHDFLGQAMGNMASLQSGPH